tara:strand:- start:239 stop:718 length:480 start_codon:yes stop_codon:yes gene_type:complete
MATKLSKKSAATANTLTKPKNDSKESKAKRDVAARKQDKKTGSTKATSDRIHDKDTGASEDKKRKASVKKRATETKKDLKKVQTARKADVKEAIAKKATTTAKKTAAMKFIGKAMARLAPGAGAAVIAADALKLAGKLSGAPEKRKSKGGQMSRTSKKK